MRSRAIIFSITLSCLLHIGAIATAVFLQQTSSHVLVKPVGDFALPVDFITVEAAPSVHKNIIPRTLSRIPSVPSAPTAQADTIANSGADRDKYLLRIIDSLTSRKQYPQESQRLGEEAELEIAFRIHRDGSVTDIRLTKASAYPRLNQAALDILKEIGKFPPLPEGMSVTDLAIKLPLAYTLD